MESILYSFKYVCLPDVSCSWPMLLGEDGEEEREHHPTRMRGGSLWKGGCMCMFVYAMSHGYVAEGVLLICVMLC